jgi:hypothetical protein
MTVSDLIETLRCLDQNATVVVKNRTDTETDDVQVYTAIDGKYANRPTQRIVCICEEDRLTPSA